MEENLEDALTLLNHHFNSFYGVVPLANKTEQTVPTDTMAWSEILVSLLTGLSGRARKKGTDLEDGSDVKAANVWEAIDTPRFNGVLPAGRKSDRYSTEENLSALDDMPFLFFVLWDYTENTEIPRCRIWAVRPPHDTAFREIASSWYTARQEGDIKSSNFQLHPPRNQNSDVIRSSFGYLKYPLYFCAVREEDDYRVDRFEPSILEEGQCIRVEQD